jgi:hypothetical protein
MRSALLLSCGLTLVSMTATLAGDAKEVPPSKDSYVKVRVEVEVRGILRHTDQGGTVTARNRVYNLFNDAEEITDPARATSYALDFARAEKLRELTKTLSGKEVVVTGTSELRLVTQQARPGGSTGFGAPAQPSAPTWSLQRTVLVTALKLAADK